MVPCTSRSMTQIHVAIQSEGSLNLYTPIYFFNKDHKDLGAKYIN